MFLINSSYHGPYEAEDEEEKIMAMSSGIDKRTSGKNYGN
jgi:hypothetical protein